MRYETGSIFAVIYDNYGVGANGPSEGLHKTAKQIFEILRIAMKPDVLSLGSFPDSIMADLQRRFTLHHFLDFSLPPSGLTPEIAQRIRAIATEANRGANRALIEMLPKL